MPSQIKKTQTQTQKDSTKRSSKKNKFKLATYVARLQERAEGNVRISTKALQTMEGMLTNLIEDVASCIGEVTRKDKKSTMSEKTVLTAIKLKCADGELSKQSVKEASRAVEKYKKGKKKHDV